MLYVRCKANSAIITLIERHPIKANPAKAGDAKLWVYCRESGNDCQAAEDYKPFVCVCPAWLIYSQAILFRMWCKNLPILYDIQKGELDGYIRNKSYAKILGRRDGYCRSHLSTACRFVQLDKRHPLPSLSGPSDVALSIFDTSPGNY